MNKKDYEIWAKQHRKYVASPAWRELRRTMPGERECIVCASPDLLHLHHMHYPSDLYQTQHCHCCWLCSSCHEAFHRRVPGTLPRKNKTWEQLRQRTITIVRRELRLKVAIIPKTIEPLKVPKNKPLKPIPPKTYASSTAPAYLKDIRKKFSGSYRKKKVSKSRLKRQAQRVAEGICKNDRIIKWFASLPEE